MRNVKMIKVNMKRICYLFILFSINIISEEVENFNDIFSLITEIKEKTNDRWEVIPQMEGGIIINSKRTFIGKFFTHSATPLAFSQKAKEQRYRIRFIFTKKIDPLEYKKILESKRKRLSSLIESLKKKVEYEVLKDYYFFKPKTEDDWKQCLEYDSLRKKLKGMPNYYYKNIGICYKPYVFYSPDNNEDEKFKKISKDIKFILSIINEYQSE